MHRAQRLMLSVVVAAGCLVGASFCAAQPAAKTHRIGVLGNENTPPWEGLRQGLRELGYVEGRNLAMDWRWSGGNPERLPALAKEVVALGPDVIVASGTQAIRAAKEATSTIPIVMAVSAYPDRLGLVASLARPGGNVTGLTNVAPELYAKKLELLKEIVPNVARVALIWNPESPIERVTLKELQATATTLGIAIHPVEVRRPEDFPAAFAALAPAQVDALLSNGNPVNFRGRALIAEFALRSGLPSVFEERLFVEAGGLVSYAPSYSDLFRRSATYVDRILKGAKPADLPVEQPTQFELVINLKTAQALGLAISPTLRLRADQLLE
ncbi:MAG: transporter substrate-binding protein [Geminicoccaceae bacterium]|nr:transporter substrate-binding protein [Geminicoccaceae bacterium]